MARKIAESLITHPATGQEFIVQSIEDGSFRIVLPNLHGARQKWAMANNFTGGDTGTRMAIVEVPVIDDRLLHSLEQAKSGEHKPRPEHSRVGQI